MKWIPIAVLALLVAIAVAASVAGGADERAECERVIEDAKLCTQCVCGDTEEVRKGAQCRVDACSCRRTKYDDWKLHRLKYHYCEFKY